MNKYNFLRIYLGLFIIAVLLIIGSLSVNIASSDEIVIYHSKYFKLRDYIRTGMISFGIPFIYKGYDLKTDDIDLIFPQEGDSRIVISEDASLQYSIFLNYSIDMANIENVVSRFGYDFNDEILKELISQTIENFIYSIPKLSILNIERVWVNERVKEILTGVLIEDGIIINEFYFKRLDIDRKHEKVGEPREVKKPRIILLYIPAIEKNIHSAVRKEFDFIEAESAVIKNSRPFCSNNDAEKVLITGKMPHNSMLFLDKINYDFDKYRSKYLWEIFDYYACNITVLFPEYFASGHSSKTVIMPVISDYGIDLCEPGLYNIPAGLTDDRDDIKKEKRAFDSNFSSVTKLGKEDLDEEIIRLRDQLFAELYLTKKALNNDQDILISFIRSLDEFVCRYIRYTFPRDPDIPVRDYIRYNRVVKGVRGIVESFILDLIRSSGDNSIVLLINPFQYKENSRKPSSIAGSKIDYLRDDGFAVFAKNRLERALSLGTDTISLQDFFPSLLSLYDFPFAKDLKGLNFFKIKQGTFFVRLINSYDGILKKGISLDELERPASQPDNRFAYPEIFSPDSMIIDRIKDGEDMLGIFLKYLEEYPFISEIYAKIGLIYYFQKDMNKAEEYYSRYIISNPYTPRGFYNLGTTYIQMNTLDKAVESYLNAYNVYKRNTEIINSIGYTYLKLNEPEKAGYYFKLSLEADPRQKDIIDLLSRHEYSNSFGSDIYERTTVCFYEIESSNPGHLEKVLSPLSMLDRNIITASLIRSVASQNRQIIFKNISIRKSEMNKELEKYIDNVAMYRFSDIFKIGEAYISLYKFDIRLENY